MSRDLHRVIDAVWRIESARIIGAVARMVREAGGTVVGIGFVVELTFLNGRQKLPSDNVFSLLQYDK